MHLSSSPHYKHAHYIYALVAVGEEVTKLIGMSEEGGYSLIPMDTVPKSAALGNGPIGEYSPPSVGEGVGQITSDDEL